MLFRLHKKIKRQYKKQKIMLSENDGAFSQLQKHWLLCNIMLREVKIGQLDNKYDLSPKQLVQLGCDIESQVLARAVKWHIEQRVILNQHKTIVFN